MTQRETAGAGPPEFHGSRPIRSLPQRSKAARPGLRQRLGLAGGLGVLVVLVALVVGAFATLRTDQAIRMVTEVQSPAVFAALRLEQAALQQDAGVREYALTGDRELLALYDAGLRGEAAALRDLDAVAAEASPEAREDLRVARQRLEAWRTRFAQPVIRQVAGGGPEGVSGETVEEGRRLFGAVLAALARQQDRLIGERAEGVARLGRAESSLYVSYTAIALALLAVAAVLALALRRNVTVPLSQLSADTRRVTTGDFSHRVEAGGPAEVAGLAEDIEAMRHRIVEELRAVRAAEARLRTQAVELAEQAAELRRSNAELEQFAYVASHDLQEPLRKVASFCQMLQRRYAGKLDERADQYIYFAVDGAKRMQTLINDLLMFSRVGRVTREHVVVDCDDILRGALDNLAAAIEESGARVTSDDLPEVPADPTLLRQLFQNLVSNAIKFRGEAPPRVHLSARRDGELWEFSCADNGIGIEPQHADRVFVIFQRLHPKEDYPGTGLGLALCKKIVEYHGGRIWIDTRAEQGTTIRWTLPARAPAGQAPGGAIGGQGAPARAGAVDRPEAPSTDPNHPP